MKRKEYTEDEWDVFAEDLCECGHKREDHIGVGPMADGSFLCYLCTDHEKRKHCQCDEFKPVASEG